MTTAVISSLHTKLAAIRKDFGPIEKTGEMKDGPRFKYVEASEIGRKWVEETSKAGITMVPVGGRVVDRYLTISGKQHVIDLEIVWRITDSATGEFIDVISWGQGADNSDKSLPKAQTNAMKYAILNVLQASGDDPEADPKTQAGFRDDPIEDTRAQRPAVVAERPAADPKAGKPGQPLLRKLMATFDEKGLKQADYRQAFTKAHVGKESSRDLTIADVEKLLVALDEYKGLPAGEVAATSSAQ